MIIIIIFLRLKKVVILQQRACACGLYITARAAPELGVVL